MDIISESSSTEASQGSVHFLIHEKVARQLDVSSSNPTTHAYVSPYSRQPLYGKQSPQLLADTCRKFGNEVRLLKTLGIDSPALTDSTSSEM